MQAAQASAAEQQQRAAAAEAAHEQAAVTAAQLQQDLDHMRVRLLYLTLRLGPCPFALPFLSSFPPPFPRTIYQAATSSSVSPQGHRSQCWGLGTAGSWW